MIARPAPEPEETATSTQPPERRIVRDEEARTTGDQDPALAIPSEGVVTAEGRTTQAAREPRRTTVQAWLCTSSNAPQPVEVAAVPELVAHDENFVWVDLANYEPEDLGAVATTLQLHAAAVHATISAWKRPHLEVFSDQFFVSATIPELDFQAYRIHARELDVFVGRNYLVSAHKAVLPFGDHVLKRAQLSPQLLDQDSAFMLYILLDELLAYYEGLEEQLLHEVEAMEERALSDTSDQYLKDLQRFKRFAFAASQLAAQHHQIFAAFLRPDFQWVTGEGVEVYFRDLEARFTTLSEALLSAKDSLNGAFDIYVSRVAHRTNQVVKLLTIVSTVLLPTSVIVGFFGTNNVAAIPFLVQPGGFVLMVLIIVVVTTSTLVVFSRRGWLR